MLERGNQQVVVSVENLVNLLNTGEHHQVTPTLVGFETSGEAWMVVELVDYNGVDLIFGSSDVHNPDWLITNSGSILVSESLLESLANGEFS